MANDVHALVGPYALDALDENEEQSFEQHLALCERCREELAGLREAAASLSNSHDPLETVLSKPGSKLVSMGRDGGVAVAPDGTAVMAVAVPPAPADKTYEAWVIEAGKAKPAGLFRGRVGTSIVEIPRAVRSGAVVAVTLEHKGGAQQPTSTPLAQSEKVKT